MTNDKVQCSCPYIDLQYVLSDQAEAWMMVHAHTNRLTQTVDSLVNCTPENVNILGMQCEAAFINVGVAVI